MIFFFCLASLWLLIVEIVLPWHVWVSEENAKEGRGMDEKLIVVLVLMPGGKFGLTNGEEIHCYHRFFFPASWVLVRAAFLINRWISDMHEDGTIHDHADSLCAAHLFYIIVSKSIQSKENFTGPRNLILHIQLVTLLDAAKAYFSGVHVLLVSLLVDQKYMDVAFINF